MFDFNPYSGPLLVTVVQGGVYTALLLARQRRDGRMSDAFAAGILLVGTLYVAQWMLGFAGWYDSRDWRTTLMFYLEWNHLAALGPLIYFYFLAATDTDFRWRRRYGWHFAPAVAFCILPVALLVYDFVIHAGVLGHPFAFFDGTRGPAMELEHASLYRLDALEDYFVYAQLSVYLFLTARAYRAYRAYVAEQFANADEFALRGLRNLLLTFVVGTGLVLLVEAISYWTGANDYVDAWWGYLAVGVVVFAAAVQFHALDPRRLRALRFSPDLTPSEDAAPSVRVGRLSPKPATPPPASSSAPTVTPSPTHTAPLSPDLERLRARLAERLWEHRDYLTPDLKLADLAAHLGTNATALSRLINAHYGTNFSDFLNGLRCEAFLNRIRAGDHERHTLLSLALDSGFNSKSTFNRAFRKLYGCSPREAVAALADAPESPVSGGEHDALQRVVPIRDLRRVRS